MVKYLKWIYGEDRAKEMEEEYVRILKKYVCDSYGIEDNFMEIDRKDCNNGRSLFAFILSMYLDMSYTEIQVYGYTNKEQVHYYFHKGKSHMDTEREYRDLFYGFKKVHKETMDKFFGLDWEDNYDKEELEVLRVSSDYVYFSVNGRSMRLEFDQIKGLGYLAKLTDKMRIGLLNYNRKGISMRYMNNEEG